MPPDLAFNLAVDGGPENEVYAMAMCIAFGKMEGGNFNWETMSWEERS